MASNYWNSSQYKRWVVDRAALVQARAIDRQFVDGPEYFEFCNIFFANVIHKLGRKLNLRQRVLATAIVFFKRFYLKNSFCETEPFIVAAACCYVAAKAEESPVHIKTVVTEAGALFKKEIYNCKSFPSEPSKLAEMEFYLLTELECDLTIHHPYKTLLALCTKQSGDQLAGTDVEMGELTSTDNVDDMMASGDGRLELDVPALQLAWFIINDTYRSDIPLLYPPHLIAMSALFLAVSQHPSTKPSIKCSSSPPSSSTTPDMTGVNTKPSDIVGFLAGLNVSIAAVTTVIEDIFAMYAFWDRYKEDDSNASGAFGGSARGAFATSGPAGSLRGSPMAGPSSPSKRGSTPGTPMSPLVFSSSKEMVMHPAFITFILTRMREQRFAEFMMQAHNPATPTSAQVMTPGAHPGQQQRWTGMAVNKRLERAQQAG